MGPELGRAGGVLGAGLAFPTGRDADPETTDENIVFGAGDYSALLSVEGFRRFGPNRTLFGLLRYRAPWNFVVGYSVGWGEHVHPEPSPGPKAMGR